jgi:glycosyltransferase involved in cell wall biosynthesis
VVPSFDSDDLPGLLARATVGAFPSYIEGFGLGVLEQLAAGLPTVAYDVPGPRAILRDLDDTLLTPAGDADALAARVVAVLRMPAQDYAALAARGRVQARRHSWNTLAERTLAVYVQRLAEVQGR